MMTVRTSQQPLKLFGAKMIISSKVKTTSAVVQINNIPYDDSLIDVRLNFDPEQDDPTVDVYMTGWGKIKSFKLDHDTIIQLIKSKFEL